MSRSGNGRKALKRRTAEIWAMKARPKDAWVKRHTKPKWRRDGITEGTEAVGAGDEADAAQGLAVAGGAGEGAVVEPAQEFPEGRE